MRMKLHNRGFSLIELLIVVSIITIITVFAVARHASFDSSTLLNNLAYEVAVTIREAQAYGISVRKASSGQFNAAYGVYFNDASGTNNSYVFFQDLNNNGAYDYNEGEHIETYVMGRGHTIADVCIIVGGASQNCSVNEIAVLFRRPKPDAIINGQSNASALITVQSRNGSARIIDVLTTGQISIHAAP